MPRIKEILQQQRKLNFVGRKRELEFFNELIKEKKPNLHLLYIYGSGGQGKTTLLKQFADTCKEHLIPTIQLDCRYIESNPGNFRQQFLQALPFPSIEAIESENGSVVLLIDTYEKLKPLDDWLRMDFLPELPDNVITVIAGRGALSTNWKTDPGWQSIIKTVFLKELTKEESREFLDRRKVPSDQVDTIVEFTHGNPLALSIAADMLAQRKASRLPQKENKEVNPLDSPEIMKTLLEQFVQEVPSPAHKAALELCSLVYVTTEKMIEEVLGPQGAGELFDWLNNLTIIEKGPSGIYPHDMARDAIANELHWRNPEWYRHLHIKLQEYFSSRILKQSGEKQRQLIFGLIFLHRMNPAIKHFFEFQESGSTWQDKLNKEDIPSLVAMVKKYEGEKASMVFNKWLANDAAAAWVFRDAEKTPAGFVLRINLEKINAKTHDETINTILPFIRLAKMEKGELVSVFRFWMSRDHHQNVSGVQSAIFLGIVQWYFTPGLGLSFLHCANPGFWKQILTYADLHHLPEFDYEDNGKTYGWYYHDWRKRPAIAWLELMGRKEINEEETLPEDTRVPKNGLTEESFIEAVYDALKHLRNQKKLRENPLVSSRFVKNATSDEPTAINLALTLADKLTKAIGSLENSPRDEGLHRILYRSFINPVGSQEQTADFLYMSFSTYRRQVKKAVERIADILWIEDQKE